MKRLKIAVVGTGGRARAHLSTIPKLEPIYQLVGVCDIDSERATETAQRLSVSGYTDIETLIEVESPDVILITVGPDGHHIITEIAASHGVHVITETPISTTLPCADRMIDAAARYGVKLEVAENVWRWPHERLKRKIVDAGLIGEITHAHLWYTSGSYHGMNAIRTLVGSEAVHAIGHAKKIGDSSWEVGIVEFENGVSLIYELPTRRRGNYWEIDGTKGAIIGNELLRYRNTGTETYPIQTVTTEVDGVEIVDHARVDTDPPVIWENPAKSVLDWVMQTMLREVRSCTASIEQSLKELNPNMVRSTDARIKKFLSRSVSLRGRVGSPIDLPLTEITGYEENLHREYRERYGVDPFDPIEKQKSILFPQRGVVWAARR